MPALASGLFRACTFAAVCCVAVSNSAGCLWQLDRNVCAMPSSYREPGSNNFNDCKIGLNVSVQLQKSFEECRPFSAESLFLVTVPSDYFNFTVKIASQIVAENFNETTKHYYVRLILSLKDLVAKHVEPFQDFVLQLKPVFKDGSCTNFSVCLSQRHNYLQYPQYLMPVILFRQLRDNAPALQVLVSGDKFRKLLTTGTPQINEALTSTATPWFNSADGYLIDGIVVKATAMDSDNYQENADPFEYSTIIKLDGTISAVVYFSDYPQYENDYADAANLIGHSLDMRSGNCQLLASCWCVEAPNFDFVETPNLKTMQIHLNITRLQSAVQELYIRSILPDLFQLQLSYARALVTFHVTAASGTVNQLITEEDFTFGVLLLVYSDHAPTVRFQVLNDSSVEAVSSSVAAAVLQSWTSTDSTVTVSEENTVGNLLVNVDVRDDDVFITDPLVYSAINTLYVSFTGAVQFSDQSLNDTGASRSVNIPLDTRSGNCQDLAWCEEVNRTNTKITSTKASVEYRLNLTELYSAVQKLYIQSDQPHLAKLSYARVVVTFHVTAASGTIKQLITSKNFTVSVLLVLPFVNSNIRDSHEQLLVLVLVVITVMVMNIMVYFFNKFWEFVVSVHTL